MELITGFPEMRVAVQTFALQHGPKLPATIAAPLTEALAAMSPVVMICDTAEIIYARRAEITDGDAKASALTVMGQCAALGATNGWHGLAVESRGLRIRQAAQRELGDTAPEGTSGPAVTADPIADNRFAPPAAPDPDATPVGPGGA